MEPSRCQAAGTESSLWSTISELKFGVFGSGSEIQKRHRHRAGGSQILLEDPSGNVVELFQPAAQ